MFLWLLLLSFSIVRNVLSLCAVRNVPSLCAVRNVSLKESSTSESQSLMSLSAKRYCVLFKRGKLLRSRRSYQSRPSPSHPSPSCKSCSASSGKSCPSSSGKLCPSSSGKLCPSPSQFSLAHGYLTLHNDGNRQQVQHKLFRWPCHRFDVWLRRNRSS